MLKVLAPLLDPRFYPLSIGFRPGSALHGLAAAEQLVERGLTPLGKVTFETRRARS